LEIIVARCIFENLTPKQASILASWFEGQGEQQCDEWFEINEVPAPLTDVGREGGYSDTQENGDVIVYCKSCN